MPFLPPNQQRQSTEGKCPTTKAKHSNNAHIIKIFLYVKNPHNSLHKMKPQFTQVLYLIITAIMFSAINFAVLVFTETKECQTATAL